MSKTWETSQIFGDSNPKDNFGWSILFEASYSRLLIGSPGYGSCKVLVYLYPIGNDYFSMITIYLVGSNEINAFGLSVQLFIDDSHFVIGSPGKEGSSSAKMCKFSDFRMYHCNEFFDK